MNSDLESFSIFYTILKLNSILIFKKLYHEEPSLDLLELGINHKLLEQGFGCVLSVWNTTLIL